MFNSEPAWLSIAVRTNGGTTFFNLSPLTPMTASPYALFANSAGTAAVANSVAASNISGTIPYTSLSALPGGTNNTMLVNTGTGLKWEALPNGNGSGSSSTSLLNGYTNLLGYGDSIMAGLGMGVTISDGFLGMVASNLALSFFDFGEGGDSVYDVGSHLYVSYSSSYPNIAGAPGSIYLLEGGVNDSGQQPNLDINIFSNILIAEAAWLSFLPGTDIFEVNVSSAQRFDANDLMGPVRQGSSIFGYVTGSFASNHWVGDWDPVHYCYGIGMASTNASDSVVLTNIAGPTFFYWHHLAVSLFPGGFTPGTNVVYVNGVSNCTVANYVTNIASNNGPPYGIGLTVITGLPTLSNSIIVISNYTACVPGYSGPRTAMSFVSGGCPGAQTTFNPVYLLGQYIPVQPGYSGPEILAENQAKRSISSFLKSVGLPVGFVGISGQVAPIYVSPDGLHPGNQGYTNIATSVQRAILNNLAWSSVSSPN